MLARPGAKRARRGPATLNRGGAVEFFHETEVAPASAGGNRGLFRCHDGRRARETGSGQWRDRAGLTPGHNPIPAPAPTSVLQSRFTGDAMMTAQAQPPVEKPNGTAAAEGKPAKKANGQDDGQAREAVAQGLSEGAAQAPGPALPPPGMGQGQRHARNHRARRARHRRQKRLYSRAQGARQPAGLPRRRSRFPERGEAAQAVPPTLRRAVSRRRRNRDVRPQLVQPAPASNG